MASQGLTPPLSISFLDVLWEFPCRREMENGVFFVREREREIRAAEISPLGIKALLRTLWNFEKFTARYDED